MMLPGCFFRLTRAIVNSAGSSLSFSHFSSVLTIDGKITVDYTKANIVNFV